MSRAPYPSTSYHPHHARMNGHAASHLNSNAESNGTSHDKVASASTALDRVLGLLDGFEVSSASLLGEKWTQGNLSCGAARLSPRSAPSTAEGYRWERGSVVEGSQQRFPCTRRKLSLDTTATPGAQQTTPSHPQLPPESTPADSGHSQDDMDCPLCLEEMDISDLNFKPCPCGYQVSPAHSRPVDDN